MYVPICTDMSLVVRKPVFGVPDQVHTNQAVQPLKMAKGLKFRIKVVERLYYPYSENKGADQLRNYCAAGLRLCFRYANIRFHPRGVTKHQSGQSVYPSERFNETPTGTFRLPARAV